MGMRSVGPCCKCGTEMSIPEELYQAALRSRGPKGIHFYCAYGHSQHYTEGETEEQKLRRERDRLKQHLAEKDDEIRRQMDRREESERSAAAYKGQATKLRNRAKNGVCPCCNRSFANLAAHIRSKHPDFGKSDTKEEKAT